MPPKTEALTTRASDGSTRLPDRHPPDLDGGALPRDILHHRLAAPAYAQAAADSRLADLRALEELRDALERRSRPRRG
jgi:hypothetical protein